MAANTPTESMKLLREVVGAQYFAVLSSLGKGLPYSNLVAFAVTDDLKSLVFVTDRKTRKYRNITENSNISLLVDNRTNQPSDITEAIAVTIIGTGREAVHNKSRLQSVFLNRHPQLRQFVYHADNALMLVTAREYIVAGFDKTQHIVVNQK